MEEGTFGAWLKEDGGRSRGRPPLHRRKRQGDPGGRVVRGRHSAHAPDGPAPGAIVPVGAVLGYLVGEDEDAPFEHAAAVTTSGAETPDPVAAPPQHAQTAPTTDAPTTGARVTADEQPASTSGRRGTGRRLDGAGRQRPHRAHRRTGCAPRLRHGSGHRDGAPGAVRARRRWPSAWPRDAGIDLADVAASGPGGRPRPAQGRGSGAASSGGRAGNAAARDPVRRRDRGARLARAPLDRAHAWSRAPRPRAGHTGPPRPTPPSWSSCANICARSLPA
ncbi:MAG: hypothetical protein R2838_14245 [Caldilineaceae bacterium]